MGVSITLQEHFEHVFCFFFQKHIQNVNSFTLPLLHHGVVHFGYPYTSIQTRENSRLIFRVFKQKGFATRIFVDFSYAFIRQYVVGMQCFHSCGWHAGKFIGTKKFLPKKGFDQAGLVHQNGLHFIMFEHRYSCRHVM